MPKNPLHAKSPLDADVVPSRRIQMADIARLAGVSSSTVSRALNDSPLVSPETRRRVAELARTMKYSINVGAQNLRRRQNTTVAVVVPFDNADRQPISDPFFLGLIGSLADSLTAHGYDMLLSRVDSAKLEAVSHLHDTGRAVGIIMVGQWQFHTQLNELASRDLPIVVWGARLPDQAYTTVGGDNVAGGYAATRHLLSLGRRRIAFFGDVRLPEPALRYEGYVRALGEHGLAPDPALTVPAAFTAVGARQATRALCVSGIPFDAVFACSDLLAMTVIGTLQDHGLQVPDQVAVVGYDDIELAQYYHPSLTTVRQPIAAAGRALVDALLLMIDGQTPSVAVLPTELVIRESSGAVGAPARRS